MPWVIGGAVLGGAYLSSQAAGDAAGAQSGASQAAVAEQQREYNLTRQDQQPWMQAGSSAVSSLANLLGLGTANYGPSTPYNGSTPLPKSQFDAQAYLNAYPDVAANPTFSADPYAHYLQEGTQGGTYRPAFQLAPGPAGSPAAGSATSNPGAPLSRTFSVADFWNDPVVQLGYQSGLDLGTKALKNAAPLTTGLDSGAALKELTQFGQDYAGRQAAGSQQRFIGDQTNLYNRYAGLAGLGQTSANTVASSGANAANNTANIITGQGNANAAATIAGANAWSGGLNSLANFWGQQRMMNRFAPQPSGPAWNPYQSYEGNGTAQPNYSAGYY